MQLLMNFYLFIWMQYKSQVDKNTFIYVRWKIIKKYGDVEFAHELDCSTRNCWSDIKPQESALHELMIRASIFFFFSYPCFRFFVCFYFFFIIFSMHLYIYYYYIVFFFFISCRHFKVYYLDSTISKVSCKAERVKDIKCSDGWTRILTPKFDRTEEGKRKQVE